MQALQEMKEIELLAEKKTIIHQLNPVTKLITTMVYIIVVISCGILQWELLLSLLLYPYLLLLLGELPISLITKRVLKTIPFLLLVGIFHPMIHREPYAVVGTVVITEGMIAFITLLLKGMLTISSVLILAATTGIVNIGAAMRKLYVPELLVTQIELLYRYLSVLGQEASNVSKAYHLRSGKVKGISLKHSGSLLTNLLFRSYDRAKAVYDAMCLRGYRRKLHRSDVRPMEKKDYSYLMIWLTLLLMIRLLNPALLIAGLMD